MRVSIFGAGYVGLVTGACLADVGNQVLCVDVNAERVAQLQAGQSPIHEPGLGQLLHKNIAAGRLQFTTSAAAAVEHGLFQMIAVGTPPDEDGSADLSYVLAVAKTIGEHMQEPRIIIDKSTVPVGTADKVHAAIATVLEQRQLALDFDVVSNPEFLKEGAAINDFMQPDRIIVGADKTSSLEKMAELYAPFTQEGRVFLGMDIRSAELAKYAANAMLATKVSFMNELSHIAERVGADIEQVRQGIGLDDRIGPRFINPGCGYGGSCFPKDVRALIASAEAENYQPLILPAVEAINNQQKQVLFNKIKLFFNDNLQGKTIALWGLAFKPDTDDMREASSRVLLEALWAAGVKVKAYDPVARDEAHRLYGARDDFELYDDPMHVLDNAEALVIATEWNEFREPDFDRIKSSLKQAIIFDGRNLYEPKQLAERGFRYFAIGRGESLWK